MFVPGKNQKSKKFTVQAKGSFSYIVQKEEQRHLNEMAKKAPKQSKHIAGFPRAMTLISVLGQIES